MTHVVMNWQSITILLPQRVTFIELQCTLYQLLIYRTS